MTPKQMETELNDLFRRQNLGVLATVSDTSEPYVSLVAFAAVEGLGRLLFLTSRATRKFRNMLSCSRVSMLIDNRTNQASDFDNALAVTVIGRAAELEGPEQPDLLRFFLDKHPELQTFALEPSSALMAIVVERYLLVSRFQEVQQLELPAGRA
jgi:nitroimidazol reductase NimA-like FMN-containing flavoprotein (pyridoxamine 5'-phosphate oxidase superfamily)